jgi:antitoxin component YwqK of YwqJK toxin-antitoxin module
MITILTFAPAKVHQSSNLMKQFLYFILIAILPITVFSQGTINKKDAAGKKQGQWIKTDTAGRKVYEGQFKDNIPQGTFKYYFQTGKLKAITVYSEDGKTATTTMYFPSGKKNAEGKYVNEKKEGLWRFFSEFDEALVSEEIYSGGLKDGPAKTFYAGKTVVETITWKKGLRDGVWTQYYDDGKIKLQGTYKNDMKDGSITVFYPTGQKFNTGQYSAGLPEGKWFSYDFDGKLLSTDVYDNGVLIKSDKKPEPPAQKIEVADPDIPK